jgi:predicted RNA-binding Zn ribbon-like protein
MSVTQKQVRNIYSLVNLIDAAQKRHLQFTPVQRLRWLLQFTELASERASSLSREDAAHWTAELFAFAFAAGHQFSPPSRKKKEEATGILNAKEIIELAQQMKQAVTKLVAGETWAFWLSSGLMAQLTSPQKKPPRILWAGAYEPVVMLTARELLAAESHRIAKCNGPGCERLFVRRKRGAYCSKRCSQRARTLRYLSSLSPEEKRQLRHDYYAAKVRQQKGTAIKVRQNQPIRPRPEEGEVKR